MDNPHIMKVVCCVCKIQYGEKPARQAGQVSHGFCPRCYEKQMAKIKNALGMPEPANLAPKKAC